MKKYWGGNVYKFPDMDVVGTFVQIKLLDKAVPEPEQLTAMADTFRMPKPLFDIAPKAKKAGRSASLGGGKRQQLSAEDFPYFVPQAPDDMMVIDTALRPAKRPKGRPRKAKSLSTADDMYFHEEEAATVASSSSASAAAAAAMMLPPSRPVRCPPEPDTESLYFFEEEEEQPATAAVVQEGGSDDALDYFFEEGGAAASDTVPVLIASSSSSSSSSYSSAFATALSHSPQQPIAPDPATIATAPVHAPPSVAIISAATLSTAASCQAPSSSSAASALRDLPSPMGLNSLFNGSPCTFTPVPGDQSQAQTQGNQGATTHEDSSPLLSAGSVHQGFDEDLNEYDDDNDDDLDDDLLTTTGYSIGSSMLEIGPLQVFVPDC